MKRIRILCMLGMLAATLVMARSVEAADPKPFAIPKRAVDLIDRGRFEDAYRELADFRRREPDNPWGLYYLAMIEQDWHRALWLYREVERLGDSTLVAEALFRRAELTYSRGDYDEADSLYLALIAGFPGSANVPEALCRRGNISLAQGYPAVALERYQSSLAQDSTGTQRLYARAGIMESYAAREDWQSALDAAVAVLAEKDDTSMFTPRVLEVMALSWKKLGNVENADKFTARLLESYPFSQQAYAVRAQANLQNPAGAPMGGSGSNTVPDSTGASFTVQAGAFSDRTNALKLLRALEDAGFAARVEMRTVRDTHFYVIRVGYFATRDAAEAAAAQIAARSGAQSNVVILE